MATPPKHIIMPPLNPMAPTSGFNMEMVPEQEQKKQCFYNGEPFNEGDFLQTNEGSAVCTRGPDGVMVWMMR